MRVEYAEDVGNYWKTSRNAPGHFVDKAVSEVEKAGGRILGHGFGYATDGRPAFVFRFEIDGEPYQLLWPLLPSKDDNELAAKRQAATALYYDVKARCVSAKMVGPHVAFAAYRMLASGQTVGELTDAELARAMPQFVRPQLTAGEDDPDS